VVPVKFSPWSIYSFLVYGKEALQSPNCFLPLVNSWAKAAFKPLLQSGVALYVYNPSYFLDGGRKVARLRLAWAI
jgi:hypothetical protein